LLLREGKNAWDLCALFVPTWAVHFLAQGCYHPGLFCVTWVIGMYQCCVVSPMCCVLSIPHPRAVTGCQGSISGTFYTNFSDLSSDSVGLLSVS